MERGLLFAYVVSVALIAWFLVPDGHGPTPYKAARALDVNTRLIETDLRAEPANSIADRLRLQNIRDSLVGKYLVSRVNRDDPVGEDSVLPWPDFKGSAVTPVQLDAEPDQRMINRGATVEVAIGETRKQLEVLAVVPSQSKWFLMFSKDAIGDVSKVEPKFQRVLSLPSPATVKPVQITPGAGPPTAETKK